MYYGYRPFISGNFDIMGDVDIGDDDFSGDDDFAGDEDLLGLSLRNVVQPHTLVTDRFKRRGGRAAAMARRASPSPIARNVAAAEAVPHALPLQFDSASNIAAGASATITITPQQPFRIEGLCVDDNVASSFLITDIKVGRKSQLIGSGAMPASAFRSGNRIGLAGDVAQTSQPVTLSVTNTSGGALRLTGLFNGTTLG